MDELDQKGLHFSRSAGSLVCRHPCLLACIDLRSITNSRVPNFELDCSQILRWERKGDGGREESMLHPAAPLNFEGRYLLRLLQFVSSSSSGQLGITSNFSPFIVGNDYLSLPVRSGRSAKTALKAETINIDLTYGCIEFSTDIIDNSFDFAFPNGFKLRH